MDGFEGEEAERLAAHRAMTGREGGPDGHARVEFTCGLCAVFAAALHDMTGWDLVAEYEHGGSDVAHVWAVDPAGRAVDVNGIHPGPWARTPYSGPSQGPTASISREECAGTGPRAEDDYCWASGLIEAHAGFYGLADRVRLAVPGGDSGAAEGGFQAGM